MSQITSWTDESMDWINPEYGLSQYAQALNNAIIERADNVGVSVGPSLPWGYPIIRRPIWENNGTLKLRLFPQHSNSVSLPEKIDEVIDELITKYLNHTYNGGDFSGDLLATGKTVDEMYPAWTISTIMEEIGDDEYLLADKYWFNLNDWAKQKYKIINLLRWTTTYSNLNDSGDIYIRGGSGTDPSWTIAYNLCIANFNASTWQLDGYDPYEHVMARALGYSQTASKTVQKKKWSETTPYLTSYIPEIYLREIRSNQTDTPYSLTTFNDDIVFLETLTETSTNTYETNYYNPQYSDINPIDPATIPCAQTHVNRYAYARVVHKFTGANGFKFKDW